MKNSTALLVALLALAASPAAHANLLTNGSFELPAGTGENQIIPGGNAVSVAGWTTTQNGVERFSPSFYGFGAAADGSIVLDICPFTFTGGGITQTFTTTPGTQYTLQYQATTVNSFGRTGDYVSTVSVGNVTQQFSGVNLSGTVAWRTFTVPFTAQTASTTLTFTNGQDANTHFCLIDAVSVTSPAVVPEGGALSLLLTGSLALVVRMRRVRAR